MPTARVVRVSSRTPRRNSDTRDRPGDRGGRAAQPPRGLREAAALGRLNQHRNAIRPVHTVEYIA